MGMKIKKDECRHPRCEVGRFFCFSVPFPCHGGSLLLLGVPCKFFFLSLVVLLFFSNGHDKLSTI